MEKILTIVVPTYNMEKYLNRCLSSLVVEPDWMDKLEVLVVNDGSKDRSQAIAQVYESKYPRTFKVIDKENGNYGSCINAALSVATGKYVKVLDADDWFDSKAFIDYLSLLNTTDVDFVFNGMYIVDGSGNVLERHCFEDRLTESTIISFKEYAEKMNGAGVYMQNVAYRLQCLRKMAYRQTEGISYTDQEWLFVPLFAVSTVAYYSSPLYYYQVGRSGQTIDYDTHIKNMWMEVSVTKSLVNAYEKYKDGIQEITESRYIFGRLMSRIRFLYSTYLLSSRDKLSVDELIDFDKFLLETDCYLYKESNRIAARLGVKYVKAWRRNYSFTNITYLLIRLKQLICKQ